MLRQMYFPVPFFLLMPLILRHPHTMDGMIGIVDWLCRCKPLFHTLRGILTDLSCLFILRSSSRSSCRTWIDASDTGVRSQSESVAGLFAQGRIPVFVSSPCYCALIVPLNNTNIFYYGSFFSLTYSIIISLMCLNFGLGLLPLLQPVSWISKVLCFSCASVWNILFWGMIFCAQLILLPSLSALRQWFGCFLFFLNFELDHICENVDFMAIS